MYLYLPLLSVLLLLPIQPPRLTVRPRVGLGPLEVRVQTRTVPVDSDRLLEVVVYEDADPPLAVIRMERDVTAWDRPLHTSVLWTLPVGTYVVVACMSGQGRGRCSEQAVLVR